MDEPLKFVMHSQHNTRASQPQDITACDWYKIILLDARGTFLLLQWFDAVGWASGRASGL